ncbi:MAG: magnesium chelatase [Bryobacteraceae bacterium]|nr:magnesium chelatase [Bryobacteraceae bacterium]MDW8379758.1 magnesium chelatase [Bryobacterales bacterium]
MSEATSRLRNVQQSLPATLGELKSSEKYSEARLTGRTVKDEMRENLIGLLQRKEPLFPGIVGYEETVVPQIVNAILARHNFILLGLRGQAKTRLIRMLTSLLDPFAPYIAGSEIRDHPYRPISRYARDLVAELGERTPIAWMTPEDRYVEKLATPDVTIADMIGDIDPIKAARRGQDISDELTIHYGLLPRANRGIFAINELPDLAGKIQVGLFNIMQEGDIQIKGYPVRLPLDVLLVFTANPEDYTARGKIITPLKDRIGSEIRTHYPLTLDHAMAITQQEAWIHRAGSPVSVTVPLYIQEVIEQIAFLARDDKKIDKRSGVSQRLPITVTENVVSSAEARAILCNERDGAARVSDVYNALPSITGKLELEYEGELRGAEVIARDLIRLAVARIYSNYFEAVNMNQIVQYFDLGGSLKLDAKLSSRSALGELQAVQGLLEKTAVLGIGPGATDSEKVSAAEFILEGLYAHRRISRHEELGFVGDDRRRSVVSEPAEEDENRRRDRKRRQYN